MASPSLVSKGTAAAVASGTTVAPALPASIAANDVLFLWANSYTGAGANNTTFTDPGGWTRVTNNAYVNQFFANNGMYGLWWLRAAGGESGTVSLVRGGTTTEVFHAQVYRVTGCRTTGDPFSAFATHTGSGGATLGYNSTAAAAADSLLAVAVNAANTALAVPADLIDATPYTEPLGRDGSALGSGSSLHGFVRENVPTTRSYSAESASGASTNGAGSVHVTLAGPPWPDPTYHDPATLRVAQSGLRNR